MELAEQINEAVTALRKQNDALELKVKGGETALAAEREKLAKMDERLNALGIELKEAGAAMKSSKLLDAAGNAVANLTKEEAEYRKSFVRAMRKGGDCTEELEALGRKAANSFYARKMGEEAKAMTVDSDPNGGFLVMPDLSGRIVEQLYETSDFSKYAASQDISTDTLSGTYDLDEVSVGLVSERGSRTVTNSPQIGRWQISVYEMYAEPQASQRLLDDALIDIEVWLQNKITNKRARLEEGYFINGLGVTQPRGILSYAAGNGTSTDLPYAGNAGKIQQIASGSSALVTFDFVKDLIGNLKSGYRKNAVFGMGRPLFTQFTKLKDSYGQYLWQPSNQIGQPDKILGYPVAEWNDMPVAAANSLSVAFGDFTQGYQIVRRTGMRMIRDAITVKGQVLFYTTWRTGGDVVNFEAFKIGKLG